MSRATLPGDEVGGAVRAVEIDAGDRHGTVRRGAGGEDHTVVEGAQVVQADVARVVHIAEETDLRLVEHLVAGGARAEPQHPAGALAQRVPLGVVERGKHVIGNFVCGFTFTS